MSHNLAQLNIGRLLAPIDAPEIAEFKGALDTINALAEASFGFVWRLKDDETNNATGLAWTADPLLIPNLSVWTSIPSLFEFVYRSAHQPFLRRRREWFEKADIVVVLWWIPDSHRPTVAEALERLEHLRLHGPTAYGFTFRHAFDHDGAALQSSP